MLRASSKPFSARVVSAGVKVSSDSMVKNFAMRAVLPPSHSKKEAPSVVSGTFGMSLSW